MVPCRYPVPAHQFYEEDNVKVSRESWLMISIVVVCFVSSSIVLTRLAFWSYHTPLTLLIASPVAKQNKLQQISPHGNRLVFGNQPDEKKIHLESFDYVWQKINESYWEADFGGVDWDRAKDELRPRIAQAKNIEEVRKVINELISRLGKSHFAIIPGNVYEATEVRRKGNADSGMKFRYAANKILVAGIRIDCDAHRQGIRPGWEVVSVGEQTASDIIKKLKDYQGVVRPETLIALRFPNLLTGDVGSRLPCRFRDSAGIEKTFKIELSKPRGTAFKFGNLPEMRIEMESKLLDSNVGYFRFNGFFDPVRLMPAFRKAVKEFQHAKGMVIDIRGNGGGMVGMTMGMASPLASHPAPLGVMKMKNTKLKLALFKTPAPYGKKIAILVDEASASASEIYAGGLQDLKVARIFGRRTAGLSLPSTVERLPNGDGFQYAFANYTSASGRVLEGNGVIPDEIVELTVDRLSRENDPTLKKAVAWIVQVTSDEGNH